MRKFTFSVAKVGSGRLEEITVEADNIHEAIKVAEVQSGGKVSAGHSHDVVNR